MLPYLVIIVNISLLILSRADTHTNIRGQNDFKQVDSSLSKNQTPIS